MQKTEDSAKNHEELMEGLGEAFSVIRKTLLEIKQKDTTPDKQIPQYFILPHSLISIVPLYISPKKSQTRRNSQSIFQKKNQISLLLPQTLICL